MQITDSLSEDLLSNAILGVILIVFFCIRDLGKRFVNSDCAYENDHWHFKLPTVRQRSPPEQDLEANVI